MFFKDINPFIRFADIVEYNISRNFTKTYDCRLLYILSGSGTINLNNELYSLEEGVLFNIQPGTPYKITPAPSFYAIAVDYDFTNDFQNEVTVFPPVPVKNFDEDKSHKTTFFDDVSAFSETVFIKNAYYVRRYTSELVEEFNSGKLFFREKSGLIFKNMMFEIARNYSNNEKKNQICNYVTNYIISNYQNNISNTQIAETLNIDPGYLNKLFKATTGKTIHKALMEQRITAASKLLLTTNTPLEKIAYETGFYNLAHFSALFKRSTGHSPSYYRKGK